jgi:hypothetical protein
VKFKLDENLSPTLAAQFVSACHEAHSVLEQALGGAHDPRLIKVCQREGRALVTLDLDSTARWSLPVAVFGRSVTISKKRGRAKRGGTASAYSPIDWGVRVESGASTTDNNISFSAPGVLEGTAHAATSATPASVLTAASNSVAEIFSPRRRMQSLIRST